MASGKAVFATLGLQAIHFRTIRGLDLGVSVTADRISMVFPVYETHPAEVPALLLEALGLRAVRNAAFNEETKILLLEIEDTEVLAKLAPDFGALYRSHTGINGVLVTAPSRTDGYDFHSRYFWPWSGTNEDPVTGGTHTFLAKYWADRLRKQRMMSFQSSSRSGFMEVALIDGQVRISSQAVIVFDGQLAL